MNHLLSACLVVPLLLLAGCPLLTSSDPDPDIVELRTEFKLELGQRVMIESEDATLTFLEKTNDSRCPLNVQCVWAGSATILIAWARGNQGTVRLLLEDLPGLSDKSAAALDTLGYRFILKRLDPYPVYDLETGQDEEDGPIVATLTVDRL